jgi:integrase
MSVEKIQRAGGQVWRVRWRDDQGRAHSRVIGRKGDAVAFDDELKRAKRLGNVIPINNDDHGETVEQFAKTWWNRYVLASLAQHTQLNYASMLDVHIVPRLGELPLADVNTETIWQLRADMTSAGVGDAAIRKTLVVLQSMLQRAVEWNRIDANPAKLVKKPSQTRSRVVRPLVPTDVEKIRKALLDDGKQMDATLIAVLAYAGLRPGEALGLRWHDIRNNTILVERSVAFGKLKTTKTGKTRTVKLLKPLADTLTTWRQVSSRNQPTDLVFPSPDGSPWNLDRTNNWRGRTFADAVSAAGLPPMRPYDLRHSYVSLMIAEGATVIEVASQAGHSPTMALSTYAHLFDEHQRADNRPAADLIRDARTSLGVPEVSVLCPPEIGREDRGAGNACKSRMGDPGFEPGTSSLSEKRSNRLS